MADDPTVNPTPVASTPETAAPPVLPGAAAGMQTGGEAAGGGPGISSEVAPSEAPAQPAAESTVEAPAAQPNQGAEAAKPAEEARKPAPSLLSEALDAEEQKAPESQPEGPPEEAPAYELKFPEGFRASDERLAPFTTFLGEAGLNQEQGQRLVDMHVAEQQRLREEVTAALTEQQHTVFNNTRAEWRTQFEQDPEIGGNRRHTTINSVIAMVRHLAGDDDPGLPRRVSEVLAFTGAGDHPDVIRLLARAARGLEQRYKEGAPVGAGQPAPQPQSRYSRRYGVMRVNGSAAQ